jgi:8-oxo-dGTP pyrophosphatase MutT (NUDIX family)
MNETVVSVFIREGKLLMERRRKDKDVYAGFVTCPSGHIKEGESLHEALRREMREELDIEVTGARHLFTIDDVDPTSKRRFRHNFMLIESFDGTVGISREAVGLLWKSYGEMDGLGLAPIARKLVDRLHGMGML